ncbi:hypothetical protein HIM_08728 [Hirsutella minnesotensis 3608]|uniref:Uncharacterized protein n=1 Tax=Hirsutella minnesotensis 3608 TaxID=1043627 RepID=A0A0F7ZSS7_9HYPO|nr:hypothetical protein HIM_08728 [Hirsutella minnesotensis 3608]
MSLQRSKKTPDFLKPPSPSHSGLQDGPLSPPPKRPTTRPPELRVDAQQCDEYLLAVSQDKEREDGGELRRFIWGDAGSPAMESVEGCANHGKVVVSQYMDDGEPSCSSVTDGEESCDGDEKAGNIETLPGALDCFDNGYGLGRGRARSASCPGQAPSSRYSSAAWDDFFTGSDGPCHETRRSGLPEMDSGRYHQQQQQQQQQQRDASVSSQSSDSPAPTPWRRTGEALAASIASSWDSDTDSEDDSESDAPSLGESASSPPSSPISEPLSPETSPGLGAFDFILPADLDIPLGLHHHRILSKHPLGTAAVVPKPLFVRPFLGLGVTGASPTADSILLSLGPPLELSSHDMSGRNLLDELPFPLQDPELPSFDVWVATMPAPPLEFAARCAWRVRNGAPGWI